MCQKINQCNNEIHITSYRNGINYNDFVDGLLYIIKNNPIICDTCNQESCYCDNKKSKKNNKNKCTRCGRDSHFSRDCHAKTTITGDKIEDSSDEEIEVFCCSYCNKEFDSLKGATCHENLYCKLKNNKQNVCYRCGRDGHYSTDCYASKHINGKYLN